MGSIVRLKPPLAVTELPQRRSNRCVVRGGVRKGFAREIEPEIPRGPARTLELRKHMRVVSRIDDNQHILKILRCRSHHARSADVDLVNERLEGNVGLGCGLDKRVEIHHDDVDGNDFVLPQRRHVVGPAAPRENAAMNRGMQRLDSTVHDFWKPRHRRDADYRHTIRFERASSAAGRHKLIADGSECAGEWKQACLVGNA